MSTNSVAGVFIQRSALINTKAKLEQEFDEPSLNNTSTINFLMCAYLDGAIRAEVKEDKPEETFLDFWDRYKHEFMSGQLAKIVNKLTFEEGLELFFFVFRCSRE